ncbi:sterol desaturase family protein [Streptomyces gardneri]|uniref:Sterol desaturase family protein n=2 Tax=Streptomyces TaxID=1883 RepID=A0A5D4J4E0_9ACTN|nr:sterol desaturase family protein [Streptomyces gardneri]TYR58633.1 sterol desaturase family protein [Streptomyces parvus]
MGNDFVRYFYAPFLLLGINGAGIALVAAGASRWWLFALLAAAVSASFAAERFIPYEPEWNDSAGDGGRDAAHAVVNETLILVSVTAVPVLAAFVTVADVWPGGWPFAVQVLFAILVADAGITLVHFASHKVGVLWRLHAVHHSVRRFYGFNGLMKHPLHQSVELTAGVAPLLAVGLPVDVAAVLALAVAVQLLLQHSNADYRVGPLRAVLSLNEGHRFHHLKWAGAGDVNFGLFTLIWDRMLGTYSFDPGRRFSSDDLGMADKPRYPSGYLAQLSEPFRARGACAADEPVDDLGQGRAKV